MLILKRGKTLFQSFPKAASTQFTLGDAVVINASGFITPATAANSTTVLGFVKRNVISTDSDYASSSLLAVQIVDGTDEIEIDASTTVTQAMVGTTRDLSNASTLNVGSGGTLNTFRVLSIGSTTSKAVVTLVRNNYGGY